MHRAIKAVLNGQTYQPNKTWQALGVHTSFCERRADDASRDVENWLKTYYMRDKVGEVFSGKISGMTSFGIFVTLDDISYRRFGTHQRFGRGLFQLPS